VQAVGARKIRRAWCFAAGVAILLALPLVLSAQPRSGNTALALQVTPEARLMPLQVTLRFHVSADGSASVMSQTAVVEAWMRAAPQQQVHLEARLTAFSGPDGTVPPETVSFSGAVLSAAGGGQAANCTAGSFQDASPLDLAAGWERPGKLACTVAFSLRGAPALPAGDYTGTVDLTLAAR